LACSATYAQSRKWAAAGVFGPNGIINEFGLPLDFLSHLLPQRNLFFQ
jgi:hypothetical protein